MAAPSDAVPAVFSATSFLLAPAASFAVAEAQINNMSAALVRVEAITPQLKLQMSTTDHQVKTFLIEQFSKGAEEAEKISSKLSEQEAALTKAMNTGNEAIDAYKTGTVPMSPVEAAPFVEDLTQAVTKVNGLLKTISDLRERAREAYSSLSGRAAQLSGVIADHKS